ncbi:LysR family transcriptional regulator [Vibrio sp. S4M6]|uniref:LysR family transcriptional regulator n=1 Tax=Vibrio sinus TaxID=2946865 RepID=UPI00202A9FB8|nr:LysR family transcriptional regulator [Vibrio sinus]MCL9780033.1 LysR family transcriptional regulator [Vibrio sinus]
MNKLESMKAFVAVCEFGNFTSASPALNMSPVMVGKHIDYLEKLLSVKLINRTTRKQSITEAGKIFLKDCIDIIERVRKAESLYDRVNDKPKGKIKITAPRLLGTSLVTPIITEYISKNPELEIELVLDDNVVNIVECGFDIAIRIGQLRDSCYLVAKKLDPYSMVVCASPEYIKIHGTPTHPTELVNHRCLNHLKWNDKLDWNTLIKDSSKNMEIKSSFSSDSGLALSHAAISGVGIAMLPSFLVRREIKNGTLLSILSEYLPKAREVNILTQHDKNPVKKVKDLVGYLESRMKNIDP